MIIYLYKFYKCYISKAQHTRSNWLQRDVALQSVATCMGVSCSQLQSVADIWQCQIFPATIRRVVSHGRVYAGELQVQELMKTCFTSFDFFADEGVLVSWVASRRSVYVLQLQILVMARCSQLLLVCRAL